MTCFPTHHFKLNMMIRCARWHGNPDILKEIYSVGNLKIPFGARNNKTLFSGAGQRKIIVSSQKGEVPGWGWSVRKTKMDGTLS